MSSKEERLSAEWLRENLNYDPATGVFSWKKPGFGRTLGKPIGSRLWTKGKSYMAMKIQGGTYYAHRVAWCYHYGEWPKGFVDHIDENRQNNSIANLRLATPAQNAARRHTKRSLAPSRGVFPHGPGYVARIHFQGKRHYLGYFKTAEEARAAYEAKAQEIHGEFAYPGAGETEKRGDYVNVPKCEMCGKEDVWGNSNIRHDTTPMGMICGAICWDCWKFTFPFGHDKTELQRMYRLAMAYFDKIDVFDIGDRRHDSSVPAVSMSELAQAKRDGVTIDLRASDG